MIDVIGPINSGAAVGGAGVATANATGSDIVHGILMGVYLRYNDSPPATTDVTIEATGGVMPTRTLLVKSDSAADGYFPVVRQALDTAGASATGWFEGQPLKADKIKVTIAQANAADNVDVFLVVKKGY